MSYKPIYNCILLILSSDDLTIYNTFKNIWKKYMHKEPTILSFFLQTNPNQLEDINISNDTIIVKTNFGQNDLIDNTIVALDYIRKNFNYNFILRTSISSFWILDRLSKELNTIPKINIYAGLLSDSPQGQQFVSGSGILLSKDIVDILIYSYNQHTDIKTHNHILNNAEDLIIASILFSNGVKCINAFTRIDFVSETSIDQLFLNLKKTDATYATYFRLKSNIDRNTYDNIAVRYLYSEYY